MVRVCPAHDMTLTIDAHERLGSPIFLARKKGDLHGAAPEFDRWSDFVAQGVRQLTRRLIVCGFDVLSSDNAVRVVQLVDSVASHPLPLR
jgi:hypothetical protein